jgi:hypothetical protein
MHRLSIGQHYDAQPTPTCFFYARPPANAAVCLLALVLRARDYPGNPRVTDLGAVRTATNDVEIFCRFHPSITPTLRLVAG